MSTYKLTIVIVVTADSPDEARDEAISLLDEGAIAVGREDIITVVQID